MYLSSAPFTRRLYIYYVGILVFVGKIPTKSKWLHTLWYILNEAILYIHWLQSLGCCAGKQLQHNFFMLSLSLKFIIGEHFTGLAA